MATTDLRKWFTTILVDKSTSDNAQTPKVATVTIYKQGATVNGAATVSVTGTAVTVRDIGRIEVGDDIVIGTEPTASMRVLSVDSATQFTLNSTTGGDVSVADGSRLVAVNSKPTLYLDVTGMETTPNPTVTDTSGFVKLYLTERVFDYKVSGTGVTTTLFEDEESGQRPPRRRHYNIMDFPGYAPQTGHNGIRSAQVDVDRALAAIPAGRALYFPMDEGPFIPPSTAGWTISKPVEIFSDMPSGNEGDCFQPYQVSKDGRVFEISSTMSKDFYLHDVVISTAEGSPAADGTGDYIHFSGNSTITNVVIDHCFLWYAGRSAVWFEGNSSVVGFRMRDCSVLGCGGHGVYINGGAMVDICTTSFIVNKGMGGVFVACGNGFQIHSSSFEFNGERLGAVSTATLPQMFGTDYNAQLYMVNSDGMITGCNIEGFLEYPTLSRNGITLNGCRGVVVGGNEFDVATSVANSVGIKLINSTIGCSILSNEFALVDKIVECDFAANDYGNAILPQMVIGSDANGPGRVVVPANSRNWVYVQDRTNGTGLANNKGVGLILPNLPTAATATTVDTGDAGSTVQAAAFEGMLVYNSADNRVQVLTSANTFAALN